jgi:hypothetical protein
VKVLPGFVDDVVEARRGLSSFSRSVIALAKPSMPSCSLSFAIWSPACMLSKVALSTWILATALAAALLASSFFGSSPTVLLSSSSSLGAIVSRSQPASSVISPTFLNDAPITSVL